ncbi:MAG: DUF3662 and FHA domain-containing protein [Coriobacteriales bacterium]|nr:DUF3662 and FHA domain-containing protein [Coriobacteriales bacterium]
MSLLSDFEDRVGRAVEGVFAGVFRSPVQPAELAKALAKQMDRERSVGVGKIYAPTLYTVLISPADEEKMGAFADTLSGELATYLIGYAAQRNYELPSRPMVRFLVDPDLKLGRFEAYAELVSSEELGRIAAEMMHSPAAPQTPREDVDFEPSAPEPVEPEAAEPEAQPMPEPPEPEPRGPVFYNHEEAEDIDFEPFVPSEAGGPIAPPAPGVVPSEPAAEAEAPFEPSELSLDSEPTPAPPGPADQVTTVLGATPGGAIATVTVTGIEHDVVLRGDRVTVGRLASCDIALQDANSSRTHAAFVPVASGWAIEDLDSTNGTWLNGQQVDRRIPLKDGDVVTVGVTELVYHGPEA